MNRAEWSSLLAAADRAELVEAGEVCLEAAVSGGGDLPQVIQGPAVGIVTLDVREPIEASRFVLGEVLVTKCVVRFGDGTGGITLMGDDREAALAGAICEAVMAGGGPGSDVVADLCARTSDRVDAERRAEWAELQPTVVSFEEMD